MNLPSLPRRQVLIRVIRVIRGYPPVPLNAGKSHTKSRNHEKEKGILSSAPLVSLYLRVSLIFALSLCLCG